jgi:hypothetical protein
MMLLHLAERTVSRLLPKRRSPPSQTWRTFLTNPVPDLVSPNLFTVPTVRLRVLFVFVVLADQRPIEMLSAILVRPNATALRSLCRPARDARAIVHPTDAHDGV